MTTDTETPTPPQLLYQPTALPDVIEQIYAALRYILKRLDALEARARNNAP